MIEAKIFLLMLVWPTGQSDARPLWATDAYLTVEDCEQAAVQRKAQAVMAHGAAARASHYCVHADDRMNP
ncbi:hypothetical protein [Parasphingorhabdus sp.]|uniref:hypothetical protein n=1 Tax=Parasphingorhabdus sp. TaxID=2709688 RepID=UPI003002FB29